jgi:hypothetical protein
MSIRVIGAGLGRTGTFSLKNALEMMGFDKCHHMYEVMMHPEQVTYWDAAGLGGPVDWDALFKGYQAVVDYPGCRYYKELMKRYPEAKVVLTTRDPDSWYDSVMSTIYAVSHPPMSRKLLMILKAPFDPRLRARLPVFRMIERDIWQGDFKGKASDRQFATDFFRRHNDEVTQTVPADRLLVYEVKQGWEPLCTFLGVPVPEDKPFPRLNSREEFGQRARVRQSGSGAAQGH